MLAENPGEKLGKSFQVTKLSVQFILVFAEEKDREVPVILEVSMPLGGVIREKPAC
ncbi:MAG TPA: hypothetical protein PLL75_02930 [Candidatus Omnitrophota bacterium]|nr:hypothetical protein [Candidatus Omnitrophota bacterium]HPS36667.1 hypothetical protein [Candidatus Omnitrophota bacterium]